VKCGGDWRMPTDQEISDLHNNCDWAWTTLNGVNGYVVRGRGAYADNSIFLPAAGSGYGTSLYNSGSYGYYWSSVPSPDSNRSDNYSWGLNFSSGYHDTYYYYYLYSGYGRYIGRSVRPVQGLAQ
ncbi:MAG: hypothetical protein ILO34_01115, partial [Kiritimatiellae bacterium]|nr:hypothetical protein [Kiritimatiellia bacterium]